MSRVALSMRWQGRTIMLARCRWSSTVRTITRVEAHEQIEDFEPIFVDQVTPLFDSRTRAVFDLDF